MRKRNLIHLLFLIVFLTLFCAVAGSEPTLSQQNLHLPAPSIQQVVKNVVWNESQASEHPTHYYRYVERNISPDGSSTSDEIATRQGRVGRLLEVDHHPPDQEQLQKNQRLLSMLPDDTQLQQSRLKDQQSNAERRDNVIKDIPNAFIYTYAGRDQKGLIMLKFRPAPGFQPSSRQSLILQGMAGELWVDPASQRMVKIDGSLIKDVKIGWGFLARLNKGGTFLMVQSQGPDGTWHQRLLSVQFDGTELIFKPIHIRVREIRCCFERVPDNLNIREAVHLLVTSTPQPRDWESRLEAIQKCISSNMPLLNRPLKQ